MSSTSLNPVIANSSTVLADIIAAKDRAGIRSAVLPRDLISHPIWLHPKTAACAGQMHRTWWEPVDITGSTHRFERHSEVLNPLGAESDKMTASPHGLLRHLDLDVTMALSHAWLTDGRSVEMELARVLRFMGYSRLCEAPYDEIRASLRRLNAAMIVLWSGPQRPEHISPIRVIESLDFQVRPGRPTILQVLLSSAWIDALKTGAWQQVDLDVYAHLIRTNRKNGLARIIYAFLATQRKSDGSFDVFKDSIVQRFAPRKPDQKRLRYKDHGNPNSALPRAMQCLIASGVIAAQDDGERVRGVFLSRDIPRIAMQPRQTALCTADLLGGGAAPQVVAITPTLDPARTSTTPASTGSNSEEFAPFTALRREFPSIAVTKYQHARDRGFDDKSMARIMVAALFGAHQGKVRKPAGWVIARLLEDNPAAWSHDAVVEQIDVSAAKTWAYGPGGPLETTTTDT